MVSQQADGGEGPAEDVVDDQDGDARIRAGFVDGVGGAWDGTCREGGACGRAGPAEAGEAAAADAGGQFRLCGGRGGGHG